MHPNRNLVANTKSQVCLRDVQKSYARADLRTRVRRFDLSQVDLMQENLFATGQLFHDNLEGISVWTHQKGATRVTMISDDNFLPILSSEVVEYILHEWLARRPDTV
jgi:hypothetical protein